MSNKKIVDFEFCLKLNHDQEGDYVGSSNRMEIKCLNRMLIRWKMDTKVINYFQDNDGKTRSAIEDADWNIKEIIDLNHTLKVFSQKFTSFNIKNSNILYGLHDR